MFGGDAGVVPCCPAGEEAGHLVGVLAGEAGVLGGDDADHGGSGVEEPEVAEALEGGEVAEAEAIEVDEVEGVGAVRLATYEGVAGGVVDEVDAELVEAVGEAGEGEEDGFEVGRVEAAEVAELEDVVELEADVVGVGDAEGVALDDVGDGPGGGDAPGKEEPGVAVGALGLGGTEVGVGHAVDEVGGTVGFDVEGEAVHGDGLEGVACLVDEGALAGEAAGDVEDLAAEVLVVGVYDAGGFHGRV